MPTTPRLPIASTAAPPSSGNFCADCGQETRAARGQRHEFLHEFIGHYVALEGKLWKTLALLLFRPGKLTAEYIAGRRARYVQPLRIYLTFSILFFALLKYGPGELIKVQPAATAVPNSLAITDKPPGPDTVRLSSKLGEFNPAWETRIRKINALPAGRGDRAGQEQVFRLRALCNVLHHADFRALPEAAVPGLGPPLRRAHAVRAASNAFAFLLLGLIWVVPGAWTGTALFIWLLAYLPVAMRRVYGGSRKATAVRWIVLMAAYVATVAAVIVGTVFMATIVL